MIQFKNLFVFENRKPDWTILVTLSKRVYNTIRVVKLPDQIEFFRHLPQCNMAQDKKLIDLDVIHIP